MVDYRKLNIGDKVKIITNDFGIYREEQGIVTGVYKDHAIMTILGDVHNWIDDDTAYLFYKV